MGLKNGCRCWSVQVGQAGRSENCRRHFKLIPLCFWSIISPHTKFHPNPMKDAEFSLLVGFGLSGWQVKKNGRRHFQLILRCFRAIISPHIKFPPSRMKYTEFENFHYWSVLVGQAGRSKNGRSHILNLYRCLQMTSLSNLNQIRQKLSKSAHYEIFSQKQKFGWLVRSALVKLAPQQIVMTCRHAKNQLDSSKRS